MAYGLAMPVLSGPAVACAQLLVIGGFAKVRRPGETVRALRLLRWPASSLLVRLLALSEVAIGFGVVVLGGRLWGLLMALSYLGFAAFGLVAMVREVPLSSCGCFGAADTPPTVSHLIVTVAACGVGVALVAHPLGPLFDGWRRQPLLDVPFVVFTGCCVWFAYAALAVLPRTAVAPGRRRGTT
jgi:hypothetical protein